MTATAECSQGGGAAPEPPPPIAPAATFFATWCRTRARRWHCGEIDLHEAVDVLQAAAEERGLVAELGQDAVQRLMSEAFAAVRADPDPDRVPDLIGQDDIPKRAATSTLIAAEYLVRVGDVDRLRKWLDAHSAKERTAIRAYLEAKRCPRSAPRK
jgi:hypothetical protein